MGVLLIIYPLRAYYTHATTPYDISTSLDNQLRNNNAATFGINKSSELRIPIPKDRTWTVKDRNSTQLTPMLILPLIPTSKTNKPQSTGRCWIQ